MSNEGWTQTPNFILDNMANMKPAVFKVCMAIVRQTCGYINKQGDRKEWDKLSTSRLMQLTGLSNSAVIDSVKEAIEQGWIERRQSGQYFEYRIQPMKKVHSLSNETYEKSSQVESTYEKSSQATYEKSSQEPMKKVHTQKKYIKENKKKVPNTATQHSPRANDEKVKLKKEPDPLTNAVMAAYIEVRGKNGVNYGKEGTFAKKIAGEHPENTTEKVKACYQWLKQDKFYEFKPVSLAKVYESLPEFLRYAERRGELKPKTAQSDWVIIDNKFSGCKELKNTKTGETKPYVNA